MTRKTAQNISHIVTIVRPRGQDKQFVIRRKWKTSDLPTSQHPPRPLVPAPPPGSSPPALVLAPKARPSHSSVLPKSPRFPFLIYDVYFEEPGDSFDPPTSLRSFQILIGQQKWPKSVSKTRSCVLIEGHLVMLRLPVISFDATIFESFSPMDKNGKIPKLAKQVLTPGNVWVKEMG